MSGVGGGEAGRGVRTVEVRYFGLLRERAGLASERVATMAADPAGLWEELAARHGFTLPAASLRVAVNDEFAAWETPLAEGDGVVYLPPVAGG